MEPFSVVGVVPAAWLVFDARVNHSAEAGHHKPFVPKQRCCRSCFAFSSRAGALAIVWSPPAAITYSTLALFRVRFNRDLWWIVLRETAFVWDNLLNNFRTLGANKGYLSILIG